MRILVLHGLGSGANNGTAKMLAKKFPNDIIWAPEIEFDPTKAFYQVKEFEREFKPDLIVGTSQGGFYTMSIDSIAYKLLINPAMDIPNDIKNGILKDNESLVQSFTKKRSNGETTYVLDESYVNALKCIKEQMDAQIYIYPDKMKIRGLFGLDDELFHHANDYKNKYNDNYKMIPTHHHLLENELEEYVFPAVQEIFKEINVDICKSKHIIFDFDGVIVDSEKVYNKSWNEAAKSYGYNLSEEELLSLRSCDSSIAMNLFGGMEDYTLVRNKRRELISNYLSKQMFELKPSVKEVFEKLKDDGYTIIVATSSAKEMVEEHLKHYDLIKYVHEVLSVKGIKRGKPYPDIYEAICKHYKLTPSEVVAIEDSPNGIESAAGANVNVIMAVDLSEPDHKIMCKIRAKTHNLNELYAALKK